MALYLGTDKVSVGNAYNIDTLLDRAVYIGSPEEPIEEQSLVADKLAVPRKIGNASFDGSADVTLESMGLGKVNNTADSDKNVTTAEKLRIKTITNLADGSQYANAFCYYPAGVIGDPPTPSDGILIGLYYGMWGAQIAFPTSGGIYARSGSYTFSAWSRLDQ